jgi:predicted nuclease with TOPRIM domain
MSDVRHKCKSLEYNNLTWLLKQDVELFTSKVESQLTEKDKEIKRLDKENEELRDEIGKWLSHVIRLDDKLGMLNDLLMEISSGYKRSEDDIEVSCFVGEVLDRPEVKALLEKDKEAGE